MGRFRAAARVVASFLFAISSSPLALAQACEDCDRIFVTGSPQVPDARRNLGRIDVTAAVDSATSFIIDAVRSLGLFARRGLAPGEVDITQQPLGADDDAATYNDVIDEDDDLQTSAVADYVAAYDTRLAPRDVEMMPDLKRKYAWQLTYRSDPADALSSAPAQSDRFPGMNTTLDDSSVVGLRFEMDFGWTP